MNRWRFSWFSMHVCVRYLFCCQVLSAAGKVGCVVVVAYGIVVCERKRRTRLVFVGPGAGVEEGLCGLILMELT